MAMRIDNEGNINNKINMKHEQLLQLYRIMFPILVTILIKLSGDVKNCVLLGSTYTINGKAK